MNTKQKLETKNQTKELLNLETNTKKSNSILPKKRFTTLINPNLLSQIKLVSYFTNNTLSNTINESIKLYIKDFESKNNTQIQSIINLKNNQNI